MRVVILDELLVNAKSRVSAPVISLEEEASAIRVNMRLDHNYTGQRCWSNAHLLLARKPSQQCLAGRVVAIEA